MTDLPGGVMLCRACDESIKGGEQRRALSRRRRRPVCDQLCSRCGELLGHEEMELRALKKKSQLAKFGLAGKRRPLLKRRDTPG